MKSRDSADQKEKIDNDHQKTVSGKKQHGPADKIGKDAGGAYGSRGQNHRSASSVKGPLQLGLTSLEVMGLAPRSSSMRATTSSAALVGGSVCRITDCKLQIAAC